MSLVNRFVLGGAELTLLAFVVFVRQVESFSIHFLNHFQICNHNR